MGEVADKEAYTIQTTNIISQLQYFVIRFFSSLAVMPLVYVVYAKGENETIR
jgi:hypothetical protein